MSMVSFVGYVNSLVVENGIMQELPNAILTQQLIMCEGAETIEKIAGEREADVKKRERDEQDLQDLNGVLKILEGYLE